MVDALRYELGVALEKQLDEDGRVELRSALATVTQHHFGGYGQLVARCRYRLAIGQE